MLDQAGGPGLLFDGDRADAHDQAIQVGEVDLTAPLWIIGDLHGDVLALEAALALIGRWSDDAMTSPPNIVLLGDLFDDDGLGLELLLRVFDLILASPGRICVVVGNHDEALSYDGSRFASSVSPGDFAEFLNANIAHEWIERAGKLAVRFFEQAPHALFLPGRIAHRPCGVSAHRPSCPAGAKRNWNDPACLRLHLDAGSPDRAQEDAKPVYARKPVRARGFRCILRAQYTDGSAGDSPGARS